MMKRSEFEISGVSDQQTWTQLLSKFTYPHPMQAWEWGEARAELGSNVHRWCVSVQDEVVLLAQVFSRTWRGITTRLAWVPRGPVFSEANKVKSALEALAPILRAQGHRVLIAQPYAPTKSSRLLPKVPFRNPEFTFVVDLQGLSKKTERLLRNKGINRFERDGGIVEEDSSNQAIEPLLENYAQLAIRKGFHPYGGPDLIRKIWELYPKDGNNLNCAYIFRAEIGSRTANSCFVIKMHRTAHFLWAASNYDMRTSGAGEAMQWHIMQKFRRMGTEFYDLEGADRKANPGVFNFKAKLGGVLVQRPPVGFMVL